MNLNDLACDKIKDLREKNGYTQLELAQKLNLERSTYTNIELGKREITLSLLQKISTIFNIAVSDILKLPSSQINQPSNIGPLSSNGINSTLNVNIPMELIEELKKVLK